MASAHYNSSLTKAEDDELDGLFKTFDSQFQDLQQKFTDMERTLQDFRSEKSPDGRRQPSIKCKARMQCPAPETKKYQPKRVFGMCSACFPVRTGMLSC
ncbi:MAG: hypothetical protein NTX06_11215 [Proteobacteria bacterium]|nr:hypothetical protein [Pseudomonadota bacterium]